MKNYNLCFGGPGCLSLSTSSKKLSVTWRARERREGNWRWVRELWYGWWGRCVHAFLDWHNHRTQSCKHMSNSLFLPSADYKTAFLLEYSLCVGAAGGGGSGFKGFKGFKFLEVFWNLTVMLRFIGLRKFFKYRSCTHQGFLEMSLLNFFSRVSRHWDFLEEGCICVQSLHCSSSYIGIFMCLWWHILGWELFFAQFWMLDPSTLYCYPASHSLFSAR